MIKGEQWKSTRQNVDCHSIHFTEKWSSDNISRKHAFWWVSYGRMQIDWGIEGRKQRMPSERWNHQKLKWHLSIDDHASATLQIIAWREWTQPIMDKLSPPDEFPNRFHEYRPKFFSLDHRSGCKIIGCHDHDETFYHFTHPYLWISCINMMIIVSTLFWSSFHELNDHAYGVLWSCFLESFDHRFSIYMIMVPRGTHKIHHKNNNLRRQNQPDH